MVNEEFDGWELSWPVRCYMAVTGIGLAVLLGTAAWLTPNPSGNGTHQQLGLPECTFKRVYDLPCPSCGMTTSWSHVMRGELPSAVRCNSGGTFLALLALGVAPWLLLMAWRGRTFQRHPSDPQCGFTAIAIVVVTLIDWFVRIS